MSGFDSHRHQYRPYFTADEILELIASLKENPLPKRMKLIKYLEGFKVRINSGLFTPQNTLNEPLIEKLGLVDIPRASSELTYNKWKLSPSSCTPAEIELATQYRYEHNLMSEQEERNYESIMGLS